MKSKQQMIKEYRKFQAQLNELREQEQILNLYLKGISRDFEELVADEWAARTKNLLTRLNEESAPGWLEDPSLNEEICRDTIWEKMCQEYIDENNPIFCSLKQ